MKPKTSIIILNWNNWKETINCLESIYQINYPNYDVILVDNDSKDGSIEEIKKYCAGKIEIKSDFFKYNPNNKPITTYEYSNKEIESLNSNNITVCPADKIFIIKNDKNYGFAEGNNIGIKFVLKNLDSKYILLLNNDTCVDKSFLSELIQVGELNDKIGFLGPKIYYYDYNGQKDVINFAGGKLDKIKVSSIHIGMNEKDYNQYDAIIAVDYVEGSCLLVKTKVLDQIGFFDRNFFAYWEENDLCIRGLKEGFKSYYVPKAKIWHKVSSSIDNPTKIYYLNRNRFWFIRKNLTSNNYILFLIYFFTFEIYFTTFLLMYRNQFNFIKPFLNGIYDGLTRSVNHSDN